jgi:tetratricopeptide (TPR) repeat protein
MVRLIAGALVAERFLFVPSAALALAVAFLPRSSPRWTAGILAPFYLVLLLPRVGLWKDDATLYASMVRDSPNSPHAHAILGQYYYRQHDFPRAIEHQKRAFQLMPVYNETLLDLSAAEDEGGQTDSALAHVRLLLRLRPDYSAAWYALGNFQVRKDQPDSAVAAYREALRLDPGLAQAENNLGVVLERMGRTEEAIGHYRRAKELLPDFPDAANNLARLSARKKP